MLPYDGETLTHECEGCGASIPLEDRYCGPSSAYCENRYSKANEHETYFFRDWQYHVWYHDEERGYHDWVTDQIEANGGEDEETVEVSL